MLDAVAELAPHSRVTAAASAFDPMPSAVRQPSWCVVRTHPKAERRAHAALHLRGFDAYLPLVTVRWRDRTWHTRPAFPSYLFVRLDLTRPWHPVTACPGVYHLLRVNSRPATCPDTVVAALREALDGAEALAGVFGTREDLYRPGAPCEAILGGGVRVEGVVVSVRDDKATIATVMFGHLREIIVSMDNLGLRDGR